MVTLDDVRALASTSPRERDLVIDAWRMVVSKRVAAAYDEASGIRSW